MYRNIEDNELVYMVREDELNFEIMQEKYKPYILNICNKYKNKAKEFGYELEDLFQIANLGLIDAIKNYNDNQNVLFFTFLTKCINNRIKTEFRNNNTNKKIILNESISYDEKVKGTDISIIDTIPSKNTVDPLDFLLIEEKQNKYINFLNSLPFEVAVIYELRQNGFSYDEISRFLEIDIKVIVKSLNIVKKRRRVYV